MYSEFILRICKIFGKIPNFLYDHNSEILRTEFSYNFFTNSPYKMEIDQKSYVVPIYCEFPKVENNSNYPTIKSKG